MRLDSAYETSVGTPDMTQIQKITLQLSDTTTNYVDFHIADLRVVPKADKAYIMFTHDDGIASQHDTVFPLLSK